jgi:hypothetical protein
VENDDALLKDLLNMDIPGFGTTEIVGTGVTPEGMSPVKVAPIANKPAPFGAPATPTRQQEKPMGMGFGV